MSKGQPELSKNAVLPVGKALQGHPESARLWADLIKSILVNNIGLKPTMQEPCLYYMQEPCLYYGNVDGKQILFPDR